MKTLTEGPYFAEINTANADITGALRTLAAVEGQIVDAMANRDIDAMIPLRTKRDAMVSMIADMRKDRDMLNTKRNAEYEQAKYAAHEAQFEGKPAFETFPDPLDPNTTITVFRGKF